MKWDSIRLDGYNTITLPREDADPGNSRYILKAIDGLGPPEKNVYIAQEAIGEGDFQNVVPTLRQLIIRMGLNPNMADTAQTVEKLRSKVYSSLYARSYQRDLAIKFMFDGEVVAKIPKAYGSKCEINPWSQKPELQLTIDTISPYLQGVEGVTPYDDAFSLDYNDLYLPNVGEEATGFDCMIYFNSNKSSPFKMFHYSPGGATKYLEIDYDFNAGDQLVLNTQERIVGRWRSGGYKDLLYRVTGSSTWLKMDPIGDNNYWFNHTDILFNYFNYLPLYWGV